MNRWRAAGRWRARPMRAPASSDLCDPRRERIDQRSARSLPEATGRCPRARTARRRCGARCQHVLIVFDHPDGDLRWADEPELHAEIVDDDRRAFAPTRSSRSAKTDCTGISTTSAFTNVRQTAVRSLGSQAPPLYYVTMPQGTMTGVVETARAGQRRSADPRSGASSPTPSASRAAAGRSSSTSARWATRKLAALRCHRRRWAPAIRSPGSTTTTRAGGSAPNNSAARRSRFRGYRSSPPDSGRSPEPHPMRPDTLDLLRCPYCSGRLGLVDVASTTGTRARTSSTAFLAATAARFRSWTEFRCMHLQPAAATARGTSRRAGPISRSRAMFDLEGEPAAAERFDCGRSVFAHGHVPRGRRRARASIRGRIFSLPVLRSHFRRRRRRGARRRRLGARRRRPGDRRLRRLRPSDADDASDPGQPPVLADLYFSKLWLARRFTAPGCEAVCCDGNSPMPFARGAFRLAVCSDAFMYIWTKRQFVAGDASSDRRRRRALRRDHRAHAQRARVEPLARPDAAAVRHIASCSKRSSRGCLPRLRCCATSSGARSVDLSRRDSAETIDSDPALTLVASRVAASFCAARCRPAANGQRRVTG